MILFVLSLLPLFLGPLIVKVLEPRRQIVRGLDAYILSTVAGIVFFHIFPEALENAGPVAFVAMTAGLILPFAIERFSTQGAVTGMKVALVIALGGLALHSILDGVGLAAPDADTGHGMKIAIAVILHRLPVGIAIWWLVKPQFGLKGAIIAVATIVIFSSIGFALSQQSSHLIEGRWWYAAQALLVGVLVHVVVHQTTMRVAGEEPPRVHIASTVGVLLGMGTLMLLSHIEPHAGAHHHHHDHGSTAESFIALALLTAPPMVVAYSLATLFHYFLPGGVSRWLSKSGGVVGAIKGTLAGLPLNVCTCAVRNTFENLVSKGASPFVAMAILVSAPEIGIATILLSIRLLGFELGLVRVAAALLIGVVVGVTIGTACKASLSSNGTPAPNPETNDSQKVERSFIKSINYGFGELADHTLPWLVMGIGVAAILDPLISHQLLESIPAYLQVPLMVAIAWPIYVCATGSTPIVAVLFFNGMSPGAALAFLLAGSSTNSSTLNAVKTFTGARTTKLYLAAILIGALGVGFAVNGMTFPYPFDEHFSHAVHEAGVLEWLTLCALAMITLFSLLRLGASGFVSTVLTLHGHSHGNADAECGHGHVCHCHPDPHDHEHHLEHPHDHNHHHH